MCDVFITRNHVARVPNTFIEDVAGTTSVETKTASTSSGRSRSSRSLSPGPSREKEKEHRERERRLGDRQLPPLGTPLTTRFYRPHIVTTIRMFSSRCHSLFLS